MHDTILMDKPKKKDCESIALQWLSRLSFSAATWNLDDHMALISRDVQVHGLPNGEVIDYSGFKRRRHNEFQKKMLLSLTHKGLELIESSEEQIHFAVKETMKSTRGESFILDKEIRLRREPDGQWRVVHETIRQISRK